MGWKGERVTNSTSFEVDKNTTAFCLKHSGCTLASCRNDSNPGEF